MLTPKEALDELKNLHYSEILKKEEFIEVKGIPVQNIAYKIANAFNVKVPITTFQPDFRVMKGPMPNHRDKCMEVWEKGMLYWKEWAKKETGKEATCPCWEDSYTGIAIMDLVNIIAAKYDIHTSKLGRGSNMREQLKQLEVKLTSERIEITTGKWVEIPLNNK